MDRILTRAFEILCEILRDRRTKVKATGDKTRRLASRIESWETAT